MKAANIINALFQGERAEHKNKRYHCPAVVPLLVASGAAIPAMFRVPKESGFFNHFMASS
jgi:hypothetical protein